jgi:hypothetical protein
VAARDTATCRVSRVAGSWLVSVAEHGASLRADLRLAYADPPYPGKAHLYPENAEVDHAELVARLCEFDGWALSTDETNLRYVLSLCPPRTRVLAWCRTNAPPMLPMPWASWEPVLVVPARTKDVPAVRSFLSDGAPLGFHQQDGLTGQKSRGFCEWVVRALGALEGDTLEDVFPGTGIMGATFAAVMAQPPLFVMPTGGPSAAARATLARKTQETLPGMPAPAPTGMAGERSRS